ncbi:DUF6779 domain-containing protein [Williamsia sp.]|uniref:DUF6779 domain-containing protein n=1 Tax=Williamsia sp. TaxID=1872085 RepID=UPI002F91E0B6
MTTPTGRSADARRTRRGPGQWLLGVLLLLALGSSVFMIVTSEMSVAGSLAVITALWAAVIGAILVTKYRRAADSADAKARDLRLVYELQLEREITARRQYELGVETQVRREVSAESGSELAALKTELQALRESLEQILGELPEERIALFREKLPELENGSAWLNRPDAAYASGFAEYPSDLVDDGAVAEQDFASTAPPAGDDAPEGDGMTEIIPVIAAEEPVPAEPEPATAEPAATDPEAAEPDEAAVEAEVEEFVGELVDEPDEATAPTAEPAARHVGGRRRADEQAEVAAEPEGFVDDTPTDEWEVIAAPEGGIPDALLAEGEDSPDHPGAHASGRSVSELLKGYASTSPSSGRRRRRS